MIEERLTDVEKLAEAMEKQQHQRGEAIVATRKRKEAMRALDEWVSHFIGVARQAFRNEAKQLEKIGIRAQ